MVPDSFFGPRALRHVIRGCESFDSSEHPGAMKKIFEDPRFEIVGQFASILNEAGIETFIKNEASAGIDGTGFGDVVRPELWVTDEARYEEALAVLKPHYEALHSEG